MNFSFTFLRYVFSGMVLLFLVTSCENTPEPDLIPTDDNPAITLLSPSTNNFLKRAGETFTVQLQLADNEALKVLRVVQRVFNEKDEVVGNGDILLPDMNVSGQNQIIDYSVNVLQINPYFKIRYTCYAIDTKGASASAVFWVSILPEPGDPAQFQVLEYTNDSIFNNKQTQAYAFNFTSRQRLPIGTNNNPLNFDIAEISNTAQAQFKPAFESPNNNYLGLDSVFVKTGPAKFNYEAATYTTIREAFYSDPAPATKITGAVGDYIIVRLTKAPQPQFAVMKITRIVDDGAGIRIGDYVKFDYKVTSQ